MQPKHEKGCRSGYHRFDAPRSERRSDHHLTHGEIHGPSGHEAHDAADAGGGVGDPNDDGQLPGSPGLNEVRTRNDQIVVLEPKQERWVIGTHTIAVEAVMARIGCHGEPDHVLDETATRRVDQIEAERPPRDPPDARPVRARPARPIAGCRLGLKVPEALEDNLVQDAGDQGPVEPGIRERWEPDRMP